MMRYLLYDEISASNGLRTTFKPELNGLEHKKLRFEKEEKIFVYKPTHFADIKVEKIEGKKHFY